MQLTEEQLKKAHGMAHHLNKMKTAVSSFHEKMTALHKAHHDDMHKAVEHMHKMVGATGSENTEFGTTHEPVPANIMSQGTTDPQMSQWKVTPVTPGTTVVTPAPVVNNTSTGVSLEEVQQLLNNSFAEFTKMFLGEDVVPAVSNQAALPAPVITTQPSQPIYNTGIGDRSNMPVQRATVVLTDKGSDNGQPVNGTPGVKLTPEMAKRAFESGSIEDQLAFMKSATPATIPVTLIEPLSKLG